MRQRDLGIAAFCLLTAGCSTAPDAPLSDEKLPDFIAPMSQEDVNQAIAAPDISQAITYHAEHNRSAMLAVLFNAADNGNPIAQLQVAELYHQGVDLPQDDKHAAVWLRKAALQGLGEAQITLAESYFAGQRAAQNPTLGWYWLRIAEAQERPEIWTMIGETYLTGVVPVGPSQQAVSASVMPVATRQQDMTEALLYLRRAAEAGDENGELALCQLYMNGQSGFPVSPKQGQPWCDRAAARGNMEARKYTVAEVQLPPKSLPQPHRDGFFLRAVGDIIEIAFFALYLALFVAAVSNATHT